MRQRAQHAALVDEPAADGRERGRRGRRKSRGVPPGTPRPRRRSPRARWSTWRTPAVPRLHTRRGAIAAGELRRRQRRQVLLAAPPLDIRVAAHGAQPRAGRIHQHTVEAGSKGSGPSRPTCTTRAAVRAKLRQRVAQQAHAPRPHVARDEHAGVVHVRGHRRRLAAGCRAQVQDALPRPGADDQRHELRRLVLDDEASVGVVQQAGMLGLLDHQPIGAQIASALRRPRAPEPRLRSRPRVTAQRVDAERQRPACCC